MGNIVLRIIVVGVGIAFIVTGYLNNDSWYVGAERSKRIEKRLGGTKRKRTFYIAFGIFAILVALVST